MKMFLPQVANEHPITGEGELMSPNTQAFAEAWMKLLGTRANLMAISDKLNRCAFLHAQYLDSRRGDELLQSMHIGRGGSYPNDRVLDIGYRLPRGYKRGVNNVESCARDPRDPATVLTELAAHDTHYEHMHCLGGFSWHIYWGCACVGIDYVALTAPPEEV